MKNSILFVFALVCATVIGGSAPVFADDPPHVALPQMASPPSPPDVAPKEDTVIGPMNHAIEAYQAGKFKEALKLSDDAQSGIRAKHVALYRALLPPAPAGGWTEEDKNDSGATLGAQLVGGLSVVGRDYKGGGHTASIAYVIDSPMITMLSGIMQAITSASGPNGSSEEIKGYKATYKEQSEDHKAAAHQLTVFAGDVVVMVQSNTLPKETLMQFANIIDYDRLKTVQ